MEHCILGVGLGSEVLHDGFRVSVLNRGAAGAVLRVGRPGRRGPLRGSGYFPWPPPGTALTARPADRTGLW